MSADVYADVRAERDRAHAKHGEKSMESAAPDDMKRLRILLEEVGEVAREFNEADIHQRPVDLAALREELIQTAAMAASWADACAPRPEPVVAPLPSEAVRGDINALSGWLDACLDGLGNHADIHSIDWLRDAVDAGVLHLVPEGDEDTVRVPRRTIDWLRERNDVAKSKTNGDSNYVDAFLSMTGPAS